MDPGTIGGIVGALGGLLGSKPQVPEYLLTQYRLLNELLGMSKSLYQNTDFDRIDRETVDSYSKGTMDRASQILRNYDASVGGAGGVMGDTKNSRNRAQIAGDASSKIAMLEADLNSSRAGRKAALLPNAAQAAAGFGAANLLDQGAAADQDARLQGLLSAATLIPGLLKGRSASSSRNDRSAALNMNPPPGTVYDPVGNVMRRDGY
jgi:hypothetical protein